MGRELPRAPLNGSALVAWLSQQALIDGPATPPSCADGLARWLGWADTIPLAAALQAPPQPPSRGALPPLAAALARLRSRLESAIADDAALAADTDFAPHRRHCSTLQQRMEAEIAALRAQIRAALARRAPAQQRLAALDAVLARVVGAREQPLLALLPSLLERHFTRLRDAQAETATAWLQQFRDDMRQLLLAELDLRLQPVQGLLDALQAQPPETP